MTIFARAPRRYRLIIACCGFLAGIAVGSVVDLSVGEYVMFLVFVGLGLFLVFRPYLVGLILLTCTLGVAGYGWASYSRAKVMLHEPLFYEGSVRVISLRFSQSPRQRVVLKLLDGAHAGRDVQSYVYDWGAEPGETVRIRSTIAPSDFSPDLGRNVIGRAENIKVQEYFKGKHWLYAFRERLQIGVGSSLPEPYASLAVGLLTGQNDNFDEGFQEDLSRTGTTHMVAVSGANLTIVALLLQRLGQKKSRYGGFWLAVTGMSLYVVLAGANPSILRGAIITFLYLWVMVSGRLSHRLPMIVLAAVILSLIHPLGMIYSLSWQLSFFAFVGMIFLGPVLGRLGQKYLGVVGATAGETLSAQILTIPLVLFRFKVVSTVSLLVNMAVLMFTPYAMAMSALLASASLISIELGRYVAWMVYPLLWVIIRPIQWASSLPFASYTLGSFTWIAFVVSYGLVVLISSSLLLLGKKLNENETA